MEILFAIELSERAHIGKGIYIAHTGGLVVAHDSVVGDFPSFHQYMTIGGAGRGEGYGNPVIGDRVYFGAGCQVVGKINIGHDVIIGANSVVNKSVPDKAAVAGVPGKILNYNGSGDFVHFRAKQEV